MSFLDWDSYRKFEKVYLAGYGIDQIRTEVSKQKAKYSDDSLFQTMWIMN